MKSLFSKSLFLVASFFVSLPVMSYSITVAVDGIKTANEYTGGIYNATKDKFSSGSKSLLWWNGHHSIYDKDDGYTNELFWEINKYKDENENKKYSLNIFFEVPTYARRMVWAPDCNYSGPGSDDDCDVIEEEYLDAYREGSHHNDGVKMDYGTQTGSEYFALKNDNSTIKKIKWQDEDSNGLTDGFTWKTSREYLIKNNICDTSLCLEYDMTSSIEMMWTGIVSKNAANLLRKSITDMELHLSDEARGLPPVVVPDPDPDPIPIPIPEPSSFVLFVMGLIGFRVFRKVRR